MVEIDTTTGLQVAHITEMKDFEEISFEVELEKDFCNANKSIVDKLADLKCVQVEKNIRILDGEEVVFYKFVYYYTRGELTIGREVLIKQHLETGEIRERKGNYMMPLEYTDALDTVVDKYFETNDFMYGAFKNSRCIFKKQSYDRGNYYDATMYYHPEFNPNEY